MPRSSRQTSNPSETPSESDSRVQADADFIQSTAYIPSAIADGPLDAPETGSNTNGPDSVVPPELIAQALGPSFQALFRAVASKRGQHWELQDFEKTALVQGWTPILQLLLAKLGNSEQVMLTLAMASTAAILAGKVAQDATKRASSMANTKTPKSAVSSAYSANEVPARQPEQSSSYEEPDEL
jgi:hypothetical protein